MKKHFQLSIKLRVTLWYTFFIVMITLISIIFLFSISNKMTSSLIKEKLVSSVGRARIHVNYNKDKLEVSPKMDSIEDSILLVYDGNNNIVYGKAFPTLEHIQFKSKEFQIIDTDNNKFYIYDYPVSFKGHPDIYIRAIIPVNSIKITNNSMFKILIFTFPFLIIISTFGGYLITKRAFRPISNITRTANEISEVNDLSQRISLYDNTKNKDELYNLAETFNNMFSRLHKSFQKEKQFTSDASHELRTPVTVIMAQAEYLLSICKSEKEKKSARVILKQSQKMSKLISDLLTIARMDNNKQKINIEEFNLSEVAYMVVEELTSLADKKNIKIIANIDENINLIADETMIMRVLINLISNAIKYGRENGFVKLHIHRQSKTVTISIYDNGIGISKENLNKVWDRFYQVDPAKTANDSGSSGLGLAITKSIIELHKGNIEVKSTLGFGSEFICKLPIDSILSVPIVKN